jgi:hypothetical protein
MKTRLLATLLALTAVPAFAAEPYLTHNGIGYHLLRQDENKALRSWEYLPQGQAAANARQVFTVHQYKMPVPPEEVVKRIAAFNARQKSLLMVDKASNAICFVVKSGNVIEANAWRYALHNKATWGNALQYRFPADTKNGLKDEIGPGSPFAKTCEDMKNWTMKYPS